MNIRTNISRMTIVAGLLVMATAAACTVDAGPLDEEMIDGDLETELFNQGTLGAPRGCGVKDSGGGTLMTGGTRRGVFCCGLSKCPAGDEDCEEGELVEGCFDCDTYTCVNELVGVPARPVAPAAVLAP